MLGSIGVRTALLDDSKAMEEAGFREYVIVSSQSPDKALDPSDEGDRARVQQIVDDLASVFVSKVARNRNVSEETVLSDFGQGDVLVGAKAVDAGMADRLGDFEQVVSELSEPMQESLFETPGATAGAGIDINLADCGHQQSEDHSMYVTNRAPAAGEEQQHTYVEASADVIRQHCPESAEALRAEGEQRASKADSADSVTAERERIAAILNCDEAQERPALAKQLALTEGMGSEAAQRVLAASAKENETGNTFLQSMEGEDIGVGPDTTSPDGDPWAMGRGIVESARTSGLVR